MSNANTLQLRIEVDDQGAIKVRTLGKDLDQTGKTGKRAAEGMDRAFKQLKTTLGGIALLALGKQIVDVMDQYTLLESRLGLVTKGSENLASVQQELYEISLRTHQSNADTVDLYTRMARATETLGLAQSTTLQITETINQALIVSGASAQESSAALIQLSQGLASGTLQGEELRSVLEQTPRLARAIAEGMGVQVGALKGLAAEGKLTSEVVAQALISQKEAIEREFSQMKTNISQSLTDLGTVVKSIIHDADEATGATSEIVNSIENLASTIDANRDGILSLFTEIVNGASASVEWIVEMSRSIGLIDANTKSGLEEQLARESTALKENRALLKDAQDNFSWVPGAGTIISYYSKETQKSVDEVQRLSQKLAEMNNADAMGSKAAVAHREQLIAKIKENEDAVTKKKTAEEAAARDAKKALEAETAARARSAEQQKKALEGIEQKAKQVSLSSYEYKKWALEKEVAEMTKAAAGNKQALDEIAEYKRIKTLQMMTYDERYTKKQQEDLEKIKDGWQVAAEGRAEADRLANAEIEQQTVETTSVVTEEWNRAFESIQSELSNTIYEFDLSAQAFVNIARRMLADILAAIIMSGIKQAILNLFDGDATTTALGGLLSGVKSALGSGKTPSGGTPGTAGAAGWGKVGGGLAVAGGAYGMYSGAKDIKNGNAGMGTLKMGMGAYSTYQGAVTLGLIEKGAATEAAKWAAAKMGFAAGAKAGAAYGSTAYTAGSGATSYGTFQAAGTGTQTAAAGGGAASGGTGAAVVGGAAYAVVAAAAVLVAYNAIKKGQRPSAENQIDEAGITPANLGGFYQGMRDVQGSILATVPTLARYQTAMYDANSQLLVATGATGTIALKYNEAAAAGHQWETFLQVGSQTFRDAALNTAGAFGVAGEGMGRAAELAMSEREALEGLNSVLQGASSSTWGLAESERSLATTARGTASDISGMIPVLANFGQATASTASQVAGAAAGIRSAWGEVSDAKNSLASLTSHIVAGKNDAKTPNIRFHADGGIFPGITQWGNHIISEEQTEALIPLPEGKDTMKRIIERIDRLSGGSDRPIIINLVVDAQAHIGDTGLTEAMRFTAKQVYVESTERKDNITVRRF